MYFWPKAETYDLIIHFHWSRSKYKKNDCNKYLQSDKILIHKIFIKIIVDITRRMFYPIESESFFVYIKKQSVEPVERYTFLSVD